MKIDKDKLRNTALDVIMIIIGFVMVGAAVWIWIGIFEWMAKHYKP